MKIQFKRRVLAALTLAGVCLGHRPMWCSASHNQFPVAKATRDEMVQMVAREVAAGQSVGLTECICQLGQSQGAVESHAY